MDVIKEVITDPLFLSILTLVTFVVVFLSFLASTTNLFKKKIPVDFGFLLDNKIVNKLDLATGDPEKEIHLRFYNSGKFTLSGIEIDIRFMRPLGLSGTNQALTLIENQTSHGALPNQGPYWVHYSNLLISGHGRFDARFELNTQGLKLGTHTISIRVHTTQHDYKYREGILHITSH